MPDEFLDKICTGNFDIYLMDYRLDHTSGLELIARQQATCPNVPGILVTGWPDGNIADASQRFGAASFLSKQNLSSLILWRTIKAVIDAAHNYRK